MKLYEKDIVTCEEMKCLEKLADQAGLSYYSMMENAGTSAAECIIHHEGEGDGEHAPSTIVFCGKGNNGGDGLVIARKLQEHYGNVTVVFVEGIPQTKDAKTNYEILSPGIAVKTLEELQEETTYDIVVDALYGTGFHGSLRPNGQRCVQLINAWGEENATVYAIDIPSGLSGDMKEYEELPFAVKADYTITFHGKKPVHTGTVQKPLLGQVIVADIGIGSILQGAEGLTK